ncbi:MAG: radical SAM protein, partial [Acidobacteria bacterium]
MSSSVAASSRAQPTVELLFPPTWNCFGTPHLAPALLKASLESLGYPAVVRDVNQWVFDDFFCRRHVRRVIDELDFRILTCKDEGLEHGLLYQEMVVGRDLARFALPRIDRSRRRLSERGSSRDLAVFEFVSRAISALFFPTLWSVRQSSYETSLTHRSPTLVNALEMASMDDQNVFARYFRHTVLPRLSPDPQRIVGISVVCEGQLIPALTLARVLRRATPEVFIVLGGSEIPFLWEALPHAPGLFDLVDAVVAGPGEGPLHRIARSRAAGTSLLGIPNIRVRTDDGKVVGEWVESEKYSALPVPDFSDLRMQDYVPRVALPVRATPRCYWNRCSFCSRANARGVSYRSPQAEEVAFALQALVEGRRATHFDFVDETLPLSFLPRLADAIGARGLSITWQCLCRFDGELSFEELKRIRRSGCLYIRWGLESASPRVLRRMQKGTQLDRARRLLERSHAAGIWNHLFLIAGYPGETEEDFEATVNFVGATREAVDSIGLSGFLVERCSEVASHPERHHLRLVTEGTQEWFIKTLPVMQGGVSPVELARRKRRLHETLIGTHISANHLNPLPYSTLLHWLVQDGKDKVRRRQQRVVRRWLEHCRSLQGPTRSVRLSASVWLGEPNRIGLDGLLYSFRTAILPNSHTFLLIEKELVDALTRPHGIPLD